VKGTPDRWKLAILLGTWCQLRRGEVLGLQRGDIDLVNHTVSVERAYVVVSGAGPMIGPPKTDEGKRKTGIPDNVLPVLRRHLHAHVGKHDNAWLFTGDDGGPAHPRTLSHVWNKARKSIGRTDLRFHDLRHTGLTLLAQSGASTREIMRRAGHKSEQAAIRYQHATDERDRVLTDALGALAKGPKIVPIKAAADKPRTEAVGRPRKQTRKVATTRKNNEQSQRGSNPCLHLERVVS
jgi:integrase